jgi:hypothetical protein
MIGSIRIADVPQLVITVIVFIILTSAVFVPLDHFPDLEKAMPAWVFAGVALFIVAASAVAGHYIWKWLDDR